MFITYREKSLLVACASLGVNILFLLYARLVLRINRIKLIISIDEKEIEKANRISNYIINGIVTVLTTVVAAAITYYMFGSL